LKVSGAFHSPFMAPASQELREAIEKTTFYNPTCPVYQNVVAKAVVSKDEIKKNLIEQLTEPVKWAQSVRAMIADGASHFTEVGPGKVLHKLIHKIDHEVIMDGVH
jgi:[acyl-carrier-protein] S-malonyltransferase